MSEMPRAQRAAPVGQTHVAVDEPLRWNSMKAAVTDLPRGASIVKTSRDQSSMQPRRRSCVVIRAPYCSFHWYTSSQTPRGRGRAARRPSPSPASSRRRPASRSPRGPSPGSTARCTRASCATATAGPALGDRHQRGPVEDRPLPPFGGGRQIENFGRLSSGPSWRGSARTPPTSRSTTPRPRAACGHLRHRLVHALRLARRRRVGVIARDLARVGRRVGLLLLAHRGSC